MLACDASLLHYALPKWKTAELKVDTLSRRLIQMFPHKYDDGFLFTWLSDSIPLLAEWGVHARTFSYWTMDTLRAQASVAPVLVVVDYTLLPYKYDPDYRNEHAIVVRAIAGGKVTYGDPYGRVVQSSLTATEAEFMRAWSSTRFIRHPRQGIAITLPEKR